jgi:cytochrome c-type biogenesis protein CcmH/NrfG
MNASSSNFLGSRPNSWRPRQVGVVVLAFLLLGILLGYLFHNSSSSGVAASRPSGSQTAASGSDRFNSTVQPLLDRLRDNPNDPDLLASVGNAYYDQHDYDNAVRYYRRYLDLRPVDVNVRTDMGTAIWYSGNPDGAISQFETALRFQPDYPNTLFNLGIVKWQGKHDREGALQSWRRLLTTHPEYPDRHKVEELIQKVQAESK